MNWIKIKNELPPLDKKVWFREKDSGSHAYATYLGLSLRKIPCFRSHSNYVVESPEVYEWREMELPLPPGDDASKEE